MAQINKPSSYFNTVLYTGNNTTHNITGVGFQPDAIWLKPRNAADHHRFLNSVSGASFHLSPNQDTAEGSNGTNFASFDSDGFTLGGSDNGWNSSSNNYVAWNWLAGGTASSNTDGTITSSVSANTTSGFSIVSYTGTGANATVGHGLGVTPAVVLVKDRTTAGLDWFMYHHKNTSEPATDYIRLNLSNATTDNVVVWNDTAPTSSVFSIGTSVGINASSDNYIAYCFSEVKGFSKFGSYTGNGNANGVFCYTGMKPAMVILKRIDAAYDWIIYDNKRDTFNPINNILKPNTSDAEITPSIYIDFTSTGFKLRTTDITFNASGGSYIYLAFAESALVGTNNIPAVAR